MGMILFSIPLLIITSYPLYQRFVLGMEQGERRGELLEDGAKRYYSEEEMKQNRENKWF
ncbi:uncharacterized protein ASCRUDRAFT_77528 [Ascoidea rubescens DSM 1968]|uniref:Uncharacterized protein n=1 Tax=Ascoidea rubescens DSM 1968 TaxID=1344418 RepID=A0A1D2VB07_9ASCO|nr:hypothetical protein ASCRUDRAFT_77528 [Ascoidea rubescens DSM 1968]ODV58780.1 hypothetical protein ASCRUDRAFT_77528 [Ascoidea rubescens DSM 1968]